MAKVIAFFLVLGIAIPIVLAIDWVFWMIWLWVLPQLWPTGPTNLITPGYWLFVGALFILGIVGRTIFGRTSK